MASNGLSARLGLLLALLLSQFTHVLAQVPKSTFVRGGRNNLTVSINVPDNSTDSLYFHFNGPAANSWIAFGFGDGMADSLMFVAYESDDGTGVTVSPRLGRGHVMPEHTDSVEVTVLEGSGIVGSQFSVNAMCTGCRSWDGGEVDVQTSSQNMIFAIGPSHSLASDDLNAPIRQHQIYDTFALSMIAATGTAGVPVPGDSDTTTDTSSGDSGSSSRGPGWGSAPGKVVAHALLMIAAFLVLFPGGYVVLRVFEKVIAHAAVQSVGMLFVIISFGLGVSISKGMRISPDLSHPHQVLGILILVLVLCTWGVGLAGHMVFRKTGNPAKFMVGHRILGPMTVSLGLANVCVGFHFAGNNRPIIPFVVVSVVMVIVVTAAVLYARRRKMRKGAMHTPAAMNFREGQTHGGQQPPPAYPQATGQQRGGPAIPLQTYQPQQAGYR